MKLFIKLGQFFFKFRDFLFGPVFLGSALLGKPRFPGGNPHLDLVMDLCGVAIAASGEVLRSLTVGYEYIKRGGLNKKVYADHLVTGGVFAHSRNPLYLGNFLILLGLALIINSWAVYWIGIPLFLLGYGSIIAVEENFLRGKFGKEYEDYCQRVNRFWPRGSGFQKSIEGMTFNWKRVISKEHGTFYVWVSGALLLRMISLYFVLGQEAVPQIRGLSWVFLPLVLSYVLVRFFKKTHRI
ncbi:MAG: S-isoprenylcysteine methyltransferase [Chlamydiae bacterium]|nr:S-isoprenylcysteine methyltransferase [Chlamydiota bacterium]